MNPDKLLTVFKRQIKRRQEKLRAWARQEDCTAYRLYDRHIPEIPLSIDLYGKYLHLSVNVSAKNSNDGAAKSSNVLSAEESTAANSIGSIPLIEIAGVAARSIGLPVENTFIQKRWGSGRFECIHLQSQANSRSDSGIDPQSQSISKRSLVTQVRDCGLNFEVNLTDYLNTGLFLDHRYTRSLVSDMSAGAYMLNLFSYTGAFSVYAAVGGARTISVDMSNTYNNWAERNMDINGIPRGKIHRIVNANALDWVDSAVRGSERFDLIVCDPPSFSNSRKMKQTFRIQSDHVSLISACLHLLARGGTLIFSSNLSGFSFNTRELGKQANIEEITRKILPPDFEGRKPNRTWVLYR